MKNKNNSENKSERVLIFRESDIISFIKKCGRSLQYMNGDESFVFHNLQGDDDHVLFPIAVMTRKIEGSKWKNE